MDNSSSRFPRRPPRIELFQDQRRKAAAGKTAQEAELYEHIGRLKMELEWLKKKLGTLD